MAPPRALRARLHAPLCALLLGGLASAGAALAQHAAPPAAAPRTHAFQDPFVQVSRAMPACPVPRGPLYTAEEVREQAHERAQHGVSCHRSGRCRLPNSYLYDAEIVPRVQHYLQQDGRFEDTSVWVQGQRRIVTLMGCVRTPAQAAAMEQAVALVDDVVGVVNLLAVGTAGPVRYPVGP